MAANPVAGSVGVSIRVTVKTRDASNVLVAVDISGVSTQQFRIKRPDGSILQVTTTFVTDGTDGQMEYTTTVSTELNTGGLYEVQPVLTGLGAFTGQLASNHFNVDGKI